jgi:pimeloyl-ACP methyl ester carboxylesterase
MMIGLNWNVNVLAVEYPGYGDINFNRGLTAINDIKSDCNTVLNFLFNECKLRGNDIILVGRSIGSMVALYCEEIMEEPPAALLLIQTFPSLKKIVQKHSCRCASWLLSGKHFDAEKQVPNIRCPVCIIHGKKDALIPYTLVEDLWKLVNPELISSN